MTHPRHCALQDLQAPRDPLAHQGVSTPFLFSPVSLTTVSRKIRETINIFLDEPHIMSFIGIFRDSLWPGGKLKPPGAPRGLEEKLRARDEANRKLSALMPGVCS